MNRKIRLFAAAAAVMIALAGCGSLSEKQKTAGAADTQTVSQETAGAADTQTDDGEYQCQLTLEGGSGKASVASPAAVKVDNGRITAKIVWSSPNYDYMVVDGQKYLNEAESAQDNSCFTIPAPAFDQPFSVIADTTAMSRPHEIEYTLTVAEPGQSAETSETEAVTDTAAETAGSTGPLSLAGLEEKGSLELKSASQFSVDFYGPGDAGKKEKDPADDYALITIGGTDRFLLVPEGGKVPADAADQGICILQAPLDQTYLVSSSVMDLVRAADAVSSIRLSGTRQEDWDIPQAAQAMEEGDILYAGKYSAPDYELLVSEGCDLAIENTMIYHKPAVKEKLESLGIPVLVERSSYETDPLGRLEWVRLYGLLYGRQTETDAFFEQEAARIGQIQKAAQEAGSDRKETMTAAFFSVASNGSITVRRPGDYMTKLIGLAGGTYVFSSLPGSSETSQSTMKMQMEDFYAGARDADILIYNSTIEGEIGSIDDLLEKNALFEDFKAVREGRVYCLDADCFQHSTMTGDLLQDLYLVLHEEESGADEMTFIRRLR